MKRTELARRTPLRRSPAPGNPASTIPKVSAKRKKENRERTKTLKELREIQPLCAMGCGKPWDDGHELKRRSAGGSITDIDNIVGLCRADHEYVTAHPKWALENGWQVSRYA